MNNLPNLIIKSIILLVLCLCTSTAIKAQPTNIVGNGNLNVFLQEMNHYFGGIMEVSTQDIGQFLQPFIANSTGQNCPAPEVSNLGYTAQEISFEWVAPTNFVAGRVGALNLLTGQQFVISIPHAYHTFTLPDGLYLFAFQQNCGSTKSMTSIIILDKVVMLEIDTKLDCTCRGAETLYDDISPEGEGYALSHDEFSVVIYEDELSANNIDYEIYFKRDCSDCETFTYNPFCLKTLGGLEVVVGNDVMYLEDYGAVTFDPLSMADFGTGGQGILLNLPPTLDYGYLLCAQNNSGKNKTNLTEDSPIHVFPNPASSLLEIRAMSDVQNIGLYNYFGQKIDTSLMPSFIPKGSSYRLDLGNLSTGFYTLSFEKEGKKFTQRFSKI